MVTSPGSSCEQLQEQNKLLWAQVRLLQANCQYLSSCNETLLDLCSSRAAGRPDNTPSGAHESLLQDQNGGAVSEGDTCNDMLDPILNKGHPIRNLDFRDQPWMLPLYSDIPAVCQTVPNRTSPSDQQRWAKERPSRSLQSSSFWMEVVADSSACCQVAQAAISPHFGTSDDLFATLPPDFIDSVSDSHDQSTFKKSCYGQDLWAKSDIDSDLHELSSSFPDNHVLYEIGTASCPLQSDGSLSMEGEAALKVQSAESGGMAPDFGAQAISQLEGLDYTMIQQPQLIPDFQQCSTMSSPGGFLDHYIFALRDVIQRLNISGGLGINHRKRLMTKGVLWVVQEAWPQAENFWKTTASFQGFLQAELWRNFPNSSVYHSMHAAYKPTMIQLTVPHSPIIDWLPWPDLRDKLIMNQDQINIDLVCKTAIQNVVAHRRAVPQPRPQKRMRRDGEGNSCPVPMTSSRVWDLCVLEETAGRKPQGGTALTYRPKSAPVRALEKAYALEYDDFQTQKLHPDFFAMYPGLFSQSLVSNYTVQELPTLRASSGHDVLGAPRPMSTASLARLEAIA